METSENIFSLIKASDNKAFELLFRLYYKKLVSFCKKFVDDEDLAQGLTQQLFVNLWENRETLQPQNPASYLFRTAKNICLNYLRHKRVVIKYQNDTDTTDDCYEIDDYDNRDQLVALYNSIEKLPPQCKQIFIMSRLQGLKHKEIADALGITIKTVKNQVGKALKFLKGNLSTLYILLIIFSILLNKIFF